MERKACFANETYHEGENKILRVSMESCNFPPSIEYSALCMGKIIELLIRRRGITTIILCQQRQFEYDYVQTQRLIELASIYKQLTQEEREKHSVLITSPEHERYIRAPYTEFQRHISHTLKADPLGAYVQLQRLLRREKEKFSALIDGRHANTQQTFIQMLEHTVNSIGSLPMIKILLQHTTEYKLGHRLIYSYVFHPTTKPDFIFTKLTTDFPDGQLIDSYNWNKSDINIFSFPESSKTLYHLTPPEFRFTEELYGVLDDAKRIMAEHKPEKEEFVNPERMREVFLSIGRDLLQDLLVQRKIKVNEEKIEELGQVLLRYTVGFGLIELLLSDPKVQDVNINSPNGPLPLFIVHQDHGDCYTNIFPTHLEVQSWATKLRLISGRPLDEANPILDTELNVTGFSSRVSAITAPLSPSGLAFSFRRHRDYPWTFPLYAQPKIRYMDQFAAGLLSFLLAHNATILIAGTRSSGKSSLLGSFLVELSRRTRILTIEDTFELPQEAMRKLGYNLESLKVAGALASKGGSEVDPSIGIRSTLRLGDSAIFVGEVRSHEAVALFEAMRVGAAANVVAGTIHADSPYGVYDRVVNDIGVPKTSFKAIDIIVVTNPVLSGTKKYKRILQITEVRKEWDDDPLKEGAFVDLMLYNPKTDKLEVTDDLINGNSMILKRMAGRVKELAGDWDAIWNNIQLRADAKQAIVDEFLRIGDASILEAGFVIKANDVFTLVSEKVKDKYGTLDNNHILFEYKDWLRKAVRKKQREAEIALR